MANWFSKKLYVQGLKKIKISGIAFSLVIILLNSFIPIMGIVESMSRGFNNNDVSAVSYNVIVPFCMLIIVLVPILAHDMFSFLNERNQSDFYHSLPQKRTCVYVSFTLAVLTWAFATILISSLVDTFLWSLASKYSLKFSTVVLGTLPYFVLSVQMAGVMILAMTVTGTKISNFLVAILFFLFFRVIGACSVFALEELTPILNVSHSFLQYFDINFFLPYALMQGIIESSFDSVFLNAPLQIYTLIVGIFFIVLGGVAYKKRRSESATQSAPNKFLQNFYRFAVTLPFIMLIALLIMVEGIEAYQIILVIIAVLVYVIYELITTKKIKNVVKSLPLIMIPILVTLLWVSGVYTVRNIINLRDFEAEDISGFSFIENGITYADYNTEKTFISDDEAEKIISRSLKNTINQAYRYDNEHYVFQTVTLKLNNGRTVTRNIYFLHSDYEKIEQIRKSNPAYLSKFLEIPSPASVENVGVYGGYVYAGDYSFDELYQTFYYEYNSLSYEDKVSVMNHTGEFSSVGQIYVRGRIGGNRYYSTFFVSYDYMPLTAQKLFELSIDYYDTVEHLEKDINSLKYYVELEEDEVDSFYVSLGFTKLTGSFSDGSSEFYVKSGNFNNIEAVCKIFDIICSSENASSADDFDNIYRVYLLVELACPNADYDMLGDYYYVTREIRVHISDENIEAIEQIISDFEDAVTEKVIEDVVTEKIIVD